MQVFHITVFLILVQFTNSALYNDFLQIQFLRDWAAYCADTHLPLYDAKEIGPEIRKCENERCIFYMYKYISDYCQEYFREFDICFETNTSKRNKTEKLREYYSN